MKSKKIYINEDCLKSPFFNKLNIDNYEIIKDEKDFLKNCKLSIDEAKETLFITNNKGSFIKACPGTKYYNCCGYQIIHIACFCNMDCSYCILQSYFKNPLLTLFLNYERLQEELEEKFQENKIHRFGTGEFTDSLIWEDIFPISKLLVEKFSTQSNSILEIKTKSTNIDKLLNLKHNQKTIISWSLNTKKIIKEEERKTSLLEKRLEAAKKCEDAGYKLAFHFDPIFIYDNCIEDYKNIIDLLFLKFDDKNIVYISFGTFRFIKDLSKTIETRFENSIIHLGEFIEGIDGKKRYFKPLRIDAYKNIISHVQKYSKNIALYFCMEDNEVWEKVFGYKPSSKGGIKKILDDAVIKHCKLKRL